MVGATIRVRVRYFVHRVLLQALNSNKRAQFADFFGIKILHDLFCAVFCGWVGGVRKKLRSTRTVEWNSRCRETQNHSGIP